LLLIADAGRAEQLWQQCAAVSQQANRAFPVCLAAAQLGHPRAMTVVGMMYDEGRGVSRDPVTARDWFEHAAALGNRGAQYNLGMMYEEADGVPKDLQRAAAYYEQSARQGMGRAQFAIGLSYEFGEGVPRDRGRAIYWLSQAGAQGDGRAGWFAEWLRRPDTPRFASEDQLGAYISSRMTSANQAAAGGVGNRCGMPVWVCEKQANSDRWKSEYHPPNTPNPYQ
jgi:TPR repeat protein